MMVNSTNSYYVEGSELAAYELTDFFVCSVVNYANHCYAVPGLT